MHGGPMPHDELADSPDSYEGATDADYVSIPVVSNAAKALAVKALSQIQFHMDKAKQINDDLGVLLAADEGHNLIAGQDSCRFAEDSEGNITLLVLLGEAG